MDKSKVVIIINHIADKFSKVAQCSTDEALNVFKAKADEIKKQDVKEQDVEEVAAYLRAAGYFEGIIIARLNIPFMHKSVEEAKAGFMEQNGFPEDIAEEFSQGVFLGFEEESFIP